MASRPDSSEIAALLEPIARRRIPGLQHTAIKAPTVCWLDRDDKDLGTPY